MQRHEDKKINIKQKDYENSVSKIERSFHKKVKGKMKKKG